MTDKPVTTNNTDATPGQTPGQNPPPASSGQSGQSSTQDTNPAWLPERLARAEQSAVNKLLKDLGFEKPDDLKTSLADLKKFRDAQMSETEKAQAEQVKLTKERDDAKAKVAELETARLVDKVNGALARVALAAKAEHPDDVIDYLRKTYAADLEPLHKDGADLGDKALAPLIEKVKRDRPGWFLTGGPGSPSNRQGKPPDPSDAAKKKLAETKLFRL